MGLHINLIERADRKLIELNKHKISHSHQSNLRNYVISDNQINLILKS